MIFEAELNRARATQQELAAALLELTAARARWAELRGQYARYQEEFERRLAVARGAGQGVAALLTCDLMTGRVEECDVPLDQPRRIQRERNDWSRWVERLTRLVEKLDRKIRVVQERKFQVDFWLLQKEETWGRVDETKVREQIREILVAAEELSKLIVGRSVKVVFDTNDTSPLGYVLIHKEVKKGRRVYLNAGFLAEQPEHLLDYYRALIVHELGHLLLHLKDSGKDYRQLRRVLREKVSLAPGFFDVFNILLDEQLERVLRDTRPEWQRWFNRLDFYARRIPVRAFQALLAQGGCADPESALQDLASRRLIKVYPDPKQPFITIQSGEVFSEGLGFTRLYAFWAVFANKLPLASIREPWLRECLALIPRDFKTLDIFAIHALAVAIYKILMQGSPGFSLVKVKVRRSGGEGVAEIELPGAWVGGPPSSSDEPLDLTLWRKDKGQRSGGRPGSERQPGGPPRGSGANAEGDPPSPPPSPPQQRRTGAKRRARRGRTVLYPRGYVPVSRPVSELPAWALDAIGQERARQEKRRQGKLRKEKRQAARRDRPPKQERKAAQPSRPASPPPPERQAAKPAPQEGPLQPPSEIAGADHLAAGSVPSWSARSAMKAVNQELNRIAQQVREELAGKRRDPASVERITPEGGRPSDQRNEADVRQFPAAEKVLRLLPDRRANALLAREVKPFVGVLRPYLRVSDPEKVAQERLMAGRRILSGQLGKHLAYGETRLFLDHRLAEAEHHGEVLVCVLIDTSASMQTDGRLARAKGVAALLAECLKECPGVESVFLGYNQNLYLCGSHEEHSLGSLEPAGKTNEASALDYLRHTHLDIPRRRKVVVVLSDGLPTACSVESVRWLVRSLEREAGVRFLHGALSSAEHPAYRRRAELVAPLDPGLVRGLGKMIALLLR